MEPGITGLADVTGERRERRRERERERERERGGLRFSGQTNVIARESCPRPPVHARAYSRGLYGDRLAAPPRVLPPRPAIMIPATMI